MPEIVHISTGVVTHIDRIHFCSSCGKANDVEKVFVAMTVAEQPELLNSLSDSDRCHMSDIEQARSIAARLDTGRPLEPLLQCEYCGTTDALTARTVTRTMQVPAFLWCRCQQEVDLRYPGDSRRVRLSARFPYAPFLYCRSCHQKMFIPAYGKDAWRTILLRLLCLVRRLAC